MARNQGSVDIRVDGAVTVLTLNRSGSLNAIDQSMAEDLIRRLDEVDGQRSCRCVVITGAGHAFCAGQALPTETGDEPLPRDIAQVLHERYIPIIQRIRGLAIPVIAAVNGVAAGSGFALALAADIRVAANTARFLCGFAAIGLIPDAGTTYFLARYVGASRAYALAATGDEISARSAERLGLVARVYSSGIFSTAYLDFARDIAAGPTRALALTKQAMNSSLESPLEEQLMLEAELQQEASASADFREGLSAFRDKRRPLFSGR